jgi:hypothetical protein
LPRNCIRYGSTLVVGDRDQRHVTEAQIQREQVGQILSAVQRGDGAACDRPEQRKMKLVNMEVQDVEVISHPSNAIEHQHVVGDRIADAGVKP